MIQILILCRKQHKESLKSFSSLEDFQYAAMKMTLASNIWSQANVGVMGPRLWATLLGSGVTTDVTRCHCNRGHNERGMMSITISSFSMQKKAPTCLL